MGILFDLEKTDKAEIYLYSVNEQTNILEHIAGNFPKDHIKLFRYIERLANFGEIRDKEKFRHIQNNIFEIKTDKLRVFCLLIPGVVPKTFILNHYYKKQGQRAPTKEINKAQRMADQIIEEYKSGALIIGGKNENNK